MVTIYHEQGFDEDKYFGVQVICPKCDGKGYFKVPYEFTHDMAVDAGIPELEGQIDEVREKCQACGGDGWIIVSKAESDEEIPY
jgi:DnaJ-class molecular chaperone